MEISVLRQEQNHMATTFDLRVSCSDADQTRADRVLERAHHCISRLERELSEFLEESPVYRLNHAATFQKIPFTVDGFSLLLEADRLSQSSQHAFNALAKSTHPSATLVWDADTREVWKTTEGAWLSFGAIGKGFALDRVRLMLAQEGFTNFILSAGGSSIFISGFQAPGIPWQWGWSWKKNAAQENLGIPLSHFSGEPMAIGVSGTHEKGAHIIGLKGGLKGEENLRSSLIAHRSATEADALSTALFVLGWDRAIGLFSQFTSPVAMAAIDEQEIPRWNGLFQKLWNGLETSSRPAFSALALSAFSLFGFLAHAPKCFAEETLDLSALDIGTNSFTPYVLERNWAWSLLPIFALLAVTLHLKKNKSLTRKKPMILNPITPKSPLSGPKNISSTLLVTALAGLSWLAMEQAKAVEIEPMGKAIMAVLGTSKALKKTIGSSTVFYARDASGKVTKAAFVQTGIYEPSCGHKWVVGIDGAKGTVTQVRPVEMACPHAFPAKAESFLDQYKGKGPADAAKLDSEIQTVAKATGTSQLTNEAVKKSILSYQQIKSQL